MTFNRSTWLAAFFALLPMGQALAADETRVGAEAQTGVAVTIYNEDLALVRDARRVTLTAGRNRLAFEEVSAAIKPETALLRGPDGQLATIEQNFDFDLLTPAKLLEKSLGETVRLITTNPATGAETVEEATVLSVADGLVLKVGERIETNPLGRIVFAAVPPSLRARPTLVLDIESAGSGETPLELSYLTGGLGWRADYVATLSADESSLDLNGLVTLTNTSGVTYNAAKLQLVAGEVNQVRPTPMMMEKMATAEMGMAPPAEEPLFEYHLYTLARPTTIAQNQTKQVALLSASVVPVTKEYRFVDIGNAYDFQMAEPRRVGATVRLGFDNSAAAHLGQPLPKGVIRVYKNSSGGEALFVGEDSIEHTPEGESVRLDLGRAFDITATSRQTDFQHLSERVIEVAFAVEIKNAKSEPVTVGVVEQIPGQWTMVEESQAHEKIGAFAAQWQVAVPAKGKTTLSYRLRLEY